MTEPIKECDRKLEQIVRSAYPQVERLMQVRGVGNLITLTFGLTIEDPVRFEKSREVGCYVGLRPRRSNSGNSEPGKNAEANRASRWLAMVRSVTAEKAVDINRPSHGSRNHWQQFSGHRKSGNR